MRPNIDFEECLKDSPRFRASLEEAEQDIDHLETKLEKLVKLCNGMIEAGKSFNNANSAFIHGLHDVSVYFSEDELVSDDNSVAQSLEKFTRVLTELQKYHNILLDQAHRSICKNLNNFVKNDIRRVKDSRKHFEKISDDMDIALVKNSQAPRSRPQDWDESLNVLAAQKSCFSHTSLDYVFQINILHTKKRFDVLDTMLAFMHAQSTYFHQGFDLFEDLDPFVKQVAAKLEDLSAKADVKKKEMEDRHNLVQQQELGVDSGTELSEEVKKEGYLFKRTSNAFKTWVRRWFMIQDNQLVYRKRSKDSLTIMEDDLRLCTVKPGFEIDRRFCFEVVSPSRSHMLQADSEAECHAWISAIQHAVSTAYCNRQQSLELATPPVTPNTATVESSGDNRSTGSSEVSGAAIEIDSKKTTCQPSPSPGSRMQQILSVAGNDKCCDCGSPDPRWTSVNLGITLCIECSGIHRSFGVHLSKVRSVTLDAWEPELLKVMTELGNNVVNGIYEAHVDRNDTVVRATPQCNRAVREVWIRSKYIEKRFLQPLQTVVDSQVSQHSKKWSVWKRKRKSAVNTKQGTSMKQGASQDSGLGSSTPDVIVFGADIGGKEIDATRCSDDTDDSGSDVEADVKSTTSCEDISNLDPDMLLYKAAQARNLPVMIEALSLGADPNWHNDQQQGKTPLIKAVESGSMAPVEFLLLNGGKVDIKDSCGRTPLHHATILGNTGQVCQFLKRHANQHAVDEDGMNPLNIAVGAANADIVTLLRLAKLNEEMKETEGIYSGQDETFNEVFRDFTHMAHNTPEKLNRNK